MKPGTASQTAVLVCMARALAHAAPPVPVFSDPTALALLPEDARARVERLIANAAARNWRERVQRIFHERRAQMMVARTVAIDEVVRRAASPQVVILGAGLDGRAWRMPELEGTVVFEVDHPDTQRDKKARVRGLTQKALDVRFVAVDFTRDDLDAALASAGHDAERPTVWIWEGVVMYLSQADVEATLRIVERRSSTGSVVTVVYVCPSLVQIVVAPFLRRLGEPLRSLFTADTMRELLARFGFRVVNDQDLFTIASALSAELGRVTRPMKHLRIATAERSGGPAVDLLH